MREFRFQGQSAKGQNWKRRDCPEHLAMACAHFGGVPLILGRVLASRGIRPENAENWLNPQLARSLPAPERIVDMRKAVERLSEALEKNEKIAFLGDYDVDGACASALMRKYWQSMQRDSQICIPDREKDGYGPSARLIERLADSGVQLLVTLDCGMTAIKPIQHAKDLGMQVVVIDHHLPHSVLPAAHAVVNPCRLDDDSGCQELSATGLAFMVLEALNRHLHARSWWRAHAVDLPNPRQWLDMVALGTVCDAMPLGALNRALVRSGLQQFGKHTPGLRVLRARLYDRENLQAHHLGFQIGPRLNAGGRLGESVLAHELLMTESETQAEILAERIEDINEERKKIQNTGLTDALARIDTGEIHDEAIFLSSPNWHMGVSGIVAARLSRIYRRPACVAVCGPDGLVRGSGRSLAGINLGRVIEKALAKGLLVSGGGHARAVGFALETAQQEAFCQFLLQELRAQMPPQGYESSLLYDDTLPARAATPEFAEAIERLSPFDSEYSEPVFVFAHHRVRWFKWVGKEKNHLQFAISETGSDRRTLRGIAFDCSPTSKLGQIMRSQKAELHFAGRITLKYLSGRAIPQLQLDDAMEAGS